MFTDKDLIQIASKGSSVEAIERQLKCFENGFPYLDVVSAATPERGITILSPSQIEAALKAYSQSKLILEKFVPASGAASRMFKDLFSSLERGELNDYSRKIVENISSFAFYDSSIFDGISPLEMIEKLLTDKGLNYGYLPKGVLKFHRYSNEVRTAFEEHLVEGAEYCQTADSQVNMTVSVSAEHLDGFIALFEAIREKYEERYNVKYNVRFTLQSPATDTIAVTEDNLPFRSEEGSLLFRPGGHGALINNLNEAQADVLIIKNIDNVVREDFLQDTITYKKLLIGYLALCRERTFSYISKLESAIAGGYSCEIEKVCEEIVGYLENEYSIKLPELSDIDLPMVLLKKLNRPIRVCGMVKNEGEPGGGPFVVKDADGSTSLQILESVQLDPSNPDTAQLFAGGTHFNPVDLVCSITDYRGEKFDLTKFVDPNAGFISSKSYQGRALKALELPGLWNGAMSDWNTVFVEVPLSTFNPVKSVMDLLRKEHLYNNKD